jgi:hypothetical protein
LLGLIEVDAEVFIVGNKAKDVSPITKRITGA